MVISIVPGAAVKEKCGEQPIPPLMRFLVGTR